MSKKDEGTREGRNDGEYGKGALDFIYEHTKEGPNLQFHDSEQLDTKTLAVVAAATAAIGFTVRLPRAEGALALWVDVSFYLAAAAWAGVVIAALLHLWPRSHRRAIRADVLSTDKYRHETGEELKRRTVADIAKAYRDNKPVLGAKAKTFRWAAFFTAIEALLRLSCGTPTPSTRRRRTRPRVPPPLLPSPIPSEPIG